MKRTPEIPAGAETVIIGGGIAGVALAYHLAKLGATDVVLLEKQDLGSGCTAGSLGGVRQQFSTPTECELGRRGREFWSTFEDDFSRPCAFNQDGYLLVTGNAATFERLYDAAAVQRSIDAGPVEMLAADGLADLVPWLGRAGLLGGCWTPHDGRTQPSDGLLGLASAARRRGVTIVQHAQVDAVDSRAGQWVVSTQGHEVVAKRVVVAAGLAAPSLLRRHGVDLSITPYLIHSALTTAVDPDVRIPVLLDLDTGLFIEREQDGCLLSVLRNEESYSTNDMLDDLADALVCRAPVLADVAIRATYSAVADLSGDGHPYVGEVEHGLWVLAGFDAHGTMHAPPLAEALARSMAGQPDASLDLGEFEPARPLRERKEWMTAARTG